MALRIPKNTQVSRAPVGGGTLRNYATPQALGTESRQTQMLGQAVSRAGQDLGELAFQRQQERNLAKVAAAEVQLSEQALQFEQEARSHKGWQADGLTDTAKDFWRKAESEQMQALENDAQRRAFAEMAAKRRMTGLSRIASHQQGELDRATLETLEASISNDINEAAANYSDPDAVAGSITSIERKTRAMAAARGWGAEQTQAYLAGQMTTAHKAVIDNLIEADPAAAQAYYEANRDSISGGDQGVIERNIETATRLGRAQSETDRIFATGGSMSEQLEAAREIDDPEVRNLTRSMIRQRHADRRAALREAQDRAWDEAAKIIADGGSQEDIPARLWNQLSGDQHLKMQDLIRKRTKQRAEFDPVLAQREYMMLREMAATNPEEFRKVKLDAYAGILKEGDLNRLQKLQLDDDGPTVLRTQKQIIDMGLVSAGLDPKDLTKDNSNGERTRAFYDRIEQEVQAFEATTGKTATKADVQEIVDRLTIQVIREGLVWDSETAAGRLEIEGVPTEMTDELAQLVRDAGQPVTEANILRLYTYMREQGKL